ncbi:MAG: response regulator [Alkalinema sp. RU_4_3]|jgi:twitching motility two-component system response regulator PilH|nr:response regulator [Alkalinema sp. RU_4_3]
MSLVLVVDDSVMAREMLVHELERNGFQVMTAIDGVEAVEQLKHKSPAIVITDLIMPRMNGYELCRHIKTEIKNVPVIMCSTKGEDFDRYWGMKQGADAYITKPYQPKDMINAVKYLLEEAGHYNEDTVGF